MIQPCISVTGDVEALEARRLLASFGVEGFTLLDDADRPIHDLNGDVVDVPLEGPTSLAIRADTFGDVRSVGFSGFSSQVENWAPYASFGDNDGDYNTRLARPGDEWHLSATGYSLHGTSGTAGRSDSITIRFVDVSVDPPTDSDDRQALFVVAEPGNVNTSERMIAGRLARAGFVLLMADDDTVTSASAAGMDLVVISKTVTSTKIGTKLNDVAAGVLFWEDNLQDELAGVSGDQSHYTSDRLDIDPDGEGHPLAAGFRPQDDLVSYTTRIRDVTDFSWGEPSRSNPDVVIVAANEKGSNDVHIYGYEEGARLDDGRTAPSRRVFFGLYDDSFRYLTAEGLRLWDAAVAWTSDSPDTDEPDQPDDDDQDGDGGDGDNGGDSGGNGGGGGDGGAVDPDDIVWSDPIVITKGGTYTGAWRSTDRSTPAVSIRTSEPVYIVDSFVTGRGDLIHSIQGSARITVVDTHGWGMNPNVHGKHIGRFVYAYNFASVNLEGNYMQGTTGMVLNGNKAGGTVRIVGNRAMNIDGRLSDGAGGFLGGGKHHRAQFINLDKVQNVPGVEIAWNQVLNEPGKSRVEDNINLYQSSGTATSPIRIHNNLIQGAYNADPANDDNFAGGGILLGDGHDGSAYAHAYENVVIGTTNYGIAISGGHSQRIYNNRVLSAGVLPDGTAIAAQNVGIYIWDYHKAGSAFHSNSGEGNLIGWVRGDGRNDWWVPDAEEWRNNTRWSSDPTLADEAEEAAQWKQRLTDR